MNADSWIHTLLGLPLPAWSAIASAVVGLSVPWIVEANVPMQEWTAYKFRLTVYGVAMLAGLVAAITLWRSADALVMWVPALGVQVVRDIASHKFPWLSPRQQARLKLDAAGNVVGYYEAGSTETKLFQGQIKAPAQPGSETETPK